jgi:hypothetical protein
LPWAKPLCWTLTHQPEAVERAIQRSLEPERTDAMPKSERERRIGELSHEIDERERYEESLITRAAAEGAEVLRRPDASPAAVLDVVVVKAQAQAVA